MRSRFEDVLTREVALRKMVDGCDPYEDRLKRESSVPASGRVTGGSRGKPLMTCWLSRAVRNHYPGTPFT